MGKEAQLAGGIGLIYDAAAGDGSWFEVGDRLCRLMNADDTVLRLADGEGVFRNVLTAESDTDVAYAAYYHALDPYRARARRDFDAARSQHVGHVKLGDELVPDQQLMRSEYYVDFARHRGRRHMLGGMVGNKLATPISLYRSDKAEPFGTKEVRLLEMLLPHFQRALDLRLRLGLQIARAAMGVDALERLPVALVVVDAGMKVWFANASAVALLATAKSGLSMTRSGPRPANDTYLTVHHRNDALEFAHLVAAATKGRAGGARRIHNEQINGRRAAQYAVMVSPVYAGWAADIPGSARLENAPKSLALVVIYDLASQVAPPPDLLCDLFGFSRAEAAVAAALAGGAGAEEVSRRRGVSLDTVRSQIRSILAKSEAANLRDFERMMASLAAMAPSPAPKEERSHPLR